MGVAEGLQSSWERAVTVAMKPEVTNGDRAYLSAEGNSQPEVAGNAAYPSM